MNPLVSCIMPTTASRATFIEAAIKTWIAQWIVPRELIIIGDHPERDFNFLSGCVRWISGFGSIGHKRNAACAVARGRFIAHWDDDDWCAPVRLVEQISVFEDPDAMLTSYQSMLFAHDRERLAWRYQNTGHAGIGTSLMYRREFWGRHRFADTSLAEDNLFVGACPASQFKPANFPSIVARVHDGNTSRKNVDAMEYSAMWHRVQWWEVERVGYEPIQ